MKKIFILHNIFAPYREGLFREISNLPGINLIVYYCSGKCPGRDWKVVPREYTYKVLKGVTVKHTFHVNLGIIYRLIKDEPDVLVVGGYAYPTAIMALLTAKKLKIPCVLWCATSLLENNIHAKSFWGKIKHMLKKTIIKLNNAYLVPGIRAQKYLEAFGVSEDKIYYMRNSFDLGFFAKKSKKIRERKNKIKKELGIDNGNVIIYVGLLKKSKGMMPLLESFRLLKDRELKINLVLVGSGPFEFRMRRICNEWKMTNVYFFGFKQKRDLPKFYGIADIFAFPSFKDAWGMVINEAMACGLPVVTTTQTGAAYDLIQNEGNGLVVKAGDFNILADAIYNILNKSEKEKKKMGQLSEKRIFSYTHRDAALQFLKAVKCLSKKINNEDS
jgi:glycosyltransferase involved in cell wall biosynthesis